MQKVNLNRAICIHLPLAFSLLEIPVTSANETLRDNCRLVDRVCQICATDEQGQTHCSSVGIACTPKEMVCDETPPSVPNEVTTPLKTDLEETQQ